MIDSLLRCLGPAGGTLLQPAPGGPHRADRDRRRADRRPSASTSWSSEVAPLVELVDAQLIDGVRMTFFEVMTALAYAAFADAPVDVAVVEVGLGGTLGRHQHRRRRRWPSSAPIDLDHTHLLGDTVAEIATEKAGIIKTGAKAVLAAQHPDAARVLMARCAEVGAEVLREGIEFGLIEPGARRRWPGAAARDRRRPARRPVPAALRRAHGTERRAGRGRGRGVPRWQVAARRRHRRRPRAGEGAGSARGGAPLADRGARHLPQPARRPGHDRRRSPRPSTSPR